MKFKDTIRHKTRRTFGQSLESTIATLNVSLRGWYEYFKHIEFQSWPYHIDRSASAMPRTLIACNDSEIG